MMQRPRIARWPTLIAAASLICLVAVVFRPILGFEFVDYDVDRQVVDNPHIRGLTAENLKHIFTSRCVRSYYPVRTLSFALDYRFWGLNPGGFKLTNGLIHLSNVLLVFWLILRLSDHPILTERSAGGYWDLAVATFSAGVFAVHPVVVEPVTWVAGREELLMTLGALGCIHFHLTARRLSATGGKNARATACFLASTACCAAACLSNAVAAVIPLLIVAFDLLTLTGPKLWKIFRGSLALWVIGIATIVVKRLNVDSDVVAVEPSWFSGDWAMLVANVYWLNLKTLIWPTRLALTHSPVLPESFLDVQVVLGAVAIALSCVVLWTLRRRKLVSFGLLWFGLALAPASQIISHHIHRADRFLYLPLVGMLLAVAMGLRPLGRVAQRRGQAAGAIIVSVSCLFLLIRLSTAQVRTWRDSVSVWENCIAVDPQNAAAHDTLGNVLSKRGESSEAMRHTRKAAELDYDNAEALHLLAQQFATSRDARLRNYDAALRLSQRACELTAWKHPRYLRGLSIVYSSHAQSLALRGETAQASEDFKHAIDADPNYDLPRYNLALLLATCPEERLRRPEEAVRMAERGYELTEDPGAEHLRILAEVFAAVGQFDKAVAAVEQAAQLAETAERPELARQLRQQLKTFREQDSSNASDR